ncbi:MAG: hypothetical protein IJM53_07570 [Lachnospiraceae bacterium]|nr:hypothetical protein [Lachnospiraceae bacterium]
MMRTAEDRVNALHVRMNARQNMKNRRKTTLIGTAGVVLTICLFLLIFTAGRTHSAGAAGMYSGSIMLFEGTGGYVLVAIIAFTVAVIFTVLCINWQKKKKEKSFTGKEENNRRENDNESLQ